ncbi:MAG: hypothetical protein Q9174_000979 [Haloplaca sp. 1 TL-2023]
MDVNHRNFHNLLPSLLAAIADAHFVALDLELSGIPGGQINKAKVPGSGSRTDGKPSLQERYEETKSAAEKYQVLQMGITCVGENRQRGVYVVRPYNFFLNPVSDERLHIERVISYQSGAVGFLLSQGFRMEGPYVDGVPYFSRIEEVEARRLEARRRDRAGIANIQIQDGDVATALFMERVRREVDGWKNDLLPMYNFLNIAPVGFEQPEYRGQGLNNFQKALIHQYIRAEHPDLATYSRPGFVQIVAYDKAREDADEQYRNKMFEQRLVRQIGLRWLVEAIHGGDLSRIDEHSLTSPGDAKSDAVVSRFNFVRRQLSGHSTVLVGHNIFLDLIYFYACFFGKLPDRVEEFEHCIHQLFPRIIDTKYLATHGLDGQALARSSLEELDKELSKQPQPTIELHPDHPKYQIATPAHEAGFDSFLTAKALIRLSAMLESSGTYVDESYYTPPEERMAKGTNNLILLDVDGLSEQLQSSSISSRKSRDKSDSITPSTSDSKRSTFSHANSFDLLGDIPSDEDPITLLPRPKKTSFEPPKSNRPKEGEIGKRMPGWDSDFWNVYGNKLRVNGTIEQTCQVGPWPQ